MRFIEIITQIEITHSQSVDTSSHGARYTTSTSN